MNSSQLNPVFHYRVECRNLPYSSEHEADCYTNDIHQARLLANAMKRAAEDCFLHCQLKDRSDTYKVFQVAPGSCVEREVYSA
jgi:hypothetical protein